MGKRNLLPKDVVKAPKKAFFLPIEKCFDASFETFIRDTLSTSALKKRGIINPGHVQSHLFSGKRELVGNKQIMLLLIFELWAQLFLDGKWKDVRTPEMSYGYR
jgi:hypothetical protein